MRWRVAARQTVRVLVDTADGSAHATVHGVAALEGGRGRLAHVEALGQCAARPFPLDGLLADAVDVLRGERSLYMSLLFINLLFVTFMPRTSYIDAFAVIRLAAGMMAAALLWSAAYRPKWLRYLAALWLPSGLLVFVLPGVVV